MMKSVFRIVTIIVALSLNFGLFAQVTTSGISGKITDTNNQTLPAAAIVATHLPSGTQYGTVSNTDGRYSLQGMRTGGPYQIQISFIGYKSFTKTDVYLQLGETYTFNVPLVEESLQLDEATVVAQAGFNSQRTGAATNIGQEQLSKLPSISRSLNDFTRLVPQAVPTGGGTSFAGTNNRYNSFQVDGAVNNDVFGLSSNGTNGGQAGTQPISIDAIEELQVVIAPFDVRQSGFTGGGINAITKSGTNKFKGSAYIYGYNQNFVGTTAGDVTDRKKLTEQKDLQYGASLGGAIKKDKLFFFVNGEITDKSYPVAFNVGEGSNITKEQADGVVDHLKTISGGYDGGGYAPKDVYTKSYKILERIDWNINEKNKFTMRHSYVDAKQLNFSRSNNNLRFSDNGYEFQSKTHTFVAELNSNLNSRMSNEARIGFTRVRDQRAYLGQPFPHVTVFFNDKKDKISLGTEEYSNANSLDQDIYSLTDNFNLNLGKHSLTFGTHNELFNIENLFIRQNFGSYQYTYEDFLKVGTPGEVNPIQYDYSYSNEEITGTRSWAPRFKAAQLGFYVQDQYSVNNRLRLTLGIRMDVPLFLDKPSENKTFNESTLAIKYGVKTNQMPKSNPLISPRLGFRYQLDEENNMLLRGGAGIFTGRIPFVWISNSFSNSGVEYIRSNFSGKSFPTGFKFNSDPYNQLAGVASKTTEINVVAKDFKYPQVFRANLAYEHKFLNGFKATLEGLYTKKINDIEYKNINAEPNGKFLNNGSDKRMLFSKTVDANYTSVILLDNTNKGYSYSATAKLEKKFNFGLDAFVAYTFGESKDVNSGSSSQAYSNWRYNEVKGNPNDPELSYSEFDIRHNVMGALTYRVEYAKNFATSVGLVYSGFSSPGYTFIYNYDINGDGSRDNDILFVPTDAQIDQMLFKGTPEQVTEQRGALKSYLAQAEGLKDIRGEYADRNSMRTDFESHFDLRIGQEFFVNTGKTRHKLELTLDILNFSNLLNREWGLYNSPSFNYAPIGVSSVDATTGVPTFTFTAPKGDPTKFYTHSDFNSRWRAQIGLRYSF